MDYTIRNIRETEYKILSDFLYEAIFIPEGVKAPPKDIINKPELQVYISDFGKHSGDYCLVAESDKKIVGAVWVRIMNDYGHVDNETPSFAISLFPEYRNHGIGTALMKSMIELLKTEKYKQASLVFLIKLPSFLKQIFHIYHFLEEEHFYKKNLVVEKPQCVLEL